MSTTARRYQDTRLSARIERLTAQELDAEIIRAGAEFDAAHTGYVVARDADFVEASERFHAAQERLDALRAAADQKN